MVETADDVRKQTILKAGSRVVKCVINEKAVVPLVRKIVDRVM